MDAALIWTPDPTRVHVRAARHAFRTDTLTLEMVEGGTLDELAADAGVPTWAPARAWLDDVEVPRARWARVRPRAGHRVTFRVVPGGGGSGDSNKTLRMVLQIVVIAIAAIATWWIGGLGGAIVGGIIMAVGTIGVTLLLPPPKPRLSSLSTPSLGQVSPTYSLTGTRNQLAPYQTVPRVYGRHRLFPPLAAYPLSEAFEGTRQSLTQAFTFGYGPLKLEEFKIGDTALTSFQHVNLELREGWPTDTPLTSIPAIRFEEGLQIELAPDVFMQHAARPDADSLSIDLTFPQGIWMVPQGYNTTQPLFVTVEGWLRELNPDGTPMGAGTWTVIGWSPWNILENRRETLRFTNVIPLPHRGYFEVRLVKRNQDFGPFGPPVELADVTFWTALRSIRNEDPAPLPGMAKAGLTIEASGQLSGVVDQFNAIATSYLREWIDGAWQVIPTRNPAAVFLDVLTGSANARPVPDAEIDFPTLIDWMEECRAKGYTYDAVHDAASTVYETLQGIAAVGRASFTMRDGKYSVVRDRVQTVPVQFFTPRNSWGFNGLKAFADIPHALKVKFINPEANWALDERIVYDDGYDLLTATKFDGLELFGVTDSALAWKHGRYYLAAMRLRPEVYELQTDVEHLVCNRGDLVHVNHDVPLWGLAAARIVSVGPSGGTTEVVIDELLDQFTPGTALALRVRQQDGSNFIGPVTITPDLDARVSRLTSAVPLPDAHPGDLVMLGTWGEETVPAIVKMIEPGENLAAKLTLVDAAPAIGSADTGPIPPFETHITHPVTLNRTVPAPVIVTVRSDQDVMQAGQPQIVVTFAVPVLAGAVAPTQVETRYRPSGSQAQWIALPPVLLPADAVLVRPVLQNQAYDIQLRSVHPRYAVSSEWVTITAHVVEGFATLPPDVLALTLDVELVELRWLYPSVPVDFAGFLVRYGQGAVERWEDALPLHDALVSDTRFHVPPLTGRFTFMVKAVDATNHESAHPARLVTDLVAVRQNILEEIDYAAAGFPGTLVALVHTGGHVCPVPTADPFVWAPAPANPLVWSSDTALVWSAVHGPGAYTLAVLVPDAHVGAGLYWNWTATGPGWLLEYDAGGDSQYWSRNDAPVWTTNTARVWQPTTWQPWPGVVTAQRAQYAFRWRFLGGAAACLDTAVLGYDVPDLEEGFPNFAVPEAGARLPITEPYRAIKMVLLTVLQGAPTDPLKGAQVIDKDPVLGPLVQVFRINSGTAEAGIVDAFIRGY